MKDLPPAVKGTLVALGAMIGPGQATIRLASGEVSFTQLVYESSAEELDGLHNN